MRIAYLTGRTYRDWVSPAGEVPAQERPDRALIERAGAAHGLQFDVRFWDDPSLPDDGYDAALIRTCWDYTSRADEFLAALQAMEARGLRVLNPSRIVAWNARKTYLQELGPAAIDTIWSEALDARQVAAAFDAFDASHLVVKPQVGAGAVRTLKLARNAWSEADLIAGPLGPAMIQPFLRSIESEGERSLFWFGGAFSHAIRKAPKAGGWLANQIGATDFFADPPPPAALQAAEAARAAMPQGAFLVRIDLVRDDAGAWRVIEIEAIEPYLFLAFAPEGARVLTAELSRVLSE